MKENKKLRFLTAEERGIDQTNQPPGDCNLYQNAPVDGKIPAWWIDELTETGEDPELLAEWLRQLASGEAQIDSR